MKQDFKKYLSHFKDKVLTNEIINFIAERYEDEIGNMLYNEGLHIGSANNSKIIQFGNCEKDYTNWSVSNNWKVEKEFKTLKGAINYINNEK